MGQRSEVMIKLGSQYYDAADVSIDYEWAIDGDAVLPELAGSEFVSV